CAWRSGELGMPSTGPAGGRGPGVAAIGGALGLASGGGSSTWRGADLGTPFASQGAVVESLAR
ncbi:MAG: hypothetical protein NT133_04670, partial [Alphaproteobacteria bacterium]|nr:hypothetical protein [Alphaproteobacteria bacterium]